MFSAFLPLISEVKAYVRQNRKIIHNTLENVIQLVSTSSEIPSCPFE